MLRVCFTSVRIGKLVRINVDEDGAKCRAIQEQNLLEVKKLEVKKKIMIFQLGKIPCDHMGKLFDLFEIQMRKHEKTEVSTSQQKYTCLRPCSRKLV